MFVIELYECEDDLESDEQYHHPFEGVRLACMEDIVEEGDIFIHEVELVLHRLEPICYIKKSIQRRIESLQSDIVPEDLWLVEEIEFVYDLVLDREEFCYELEEIFFSHADGPEILDVIIEVDLLEELLCDLLIVLHRHGMCE